MAGLFQTLKGAARGLHVDALLDNMLKSRGIPRDMVFAKAFQGVPVSKMTDLIGQTSVDSDLRIYDATAGAEGKIQRVGFNVGAPLSYELQVLALEALIPNVYNGATDAIFDYAQRQSQYPTDRLKFRLEYGAIVQTLRNASVMTQNITLPAAQKWSNKGSPDSSPLDDLLTWVRWVREKAARPIGMIYMTAPVWNEIAQHPSVLGRRDVTTWGVFTKEVLEKILGVEPGTVYVDEFGIYNAPGLTGTTAQRYFGGPDLAILVTGGASRQNFDFGHMYFMGGSGDDPIVTLRYPTYDVARFGEVVQCSAFVHFLVEKPEAALVAFGVVDPTLARFNGMLS